MAFRHPATAKRPTPINVVATTIVKMTTRRIGARPAIIWRGCGASRRNEQTAARRGYSDSLDHPTLIGTAEVKIEKTLHPQLL